MRDVTRLLKVQWFVSGDVRRGEEKHRGLHRSISIRCDDVLENLRKATPCFMVRFGRKDLMRRSRSRWKGRNGPVDPQVSKKKAKWFYLFPLHNPGNACKGKMKETSTQKEERQRLIVLVFLVISKGNARKQIGP